MQGNEHPPRGRAAQAGSLRPIPIRSADMYANCMFCHKPLGRNEVVEPFPVGRRLAFDPSRGRLWVVCLKCERWNLTPLEERWEAVEECERLFRGTRVRASSENIGLARHPEGLTLVRIGKPLRPEFAAWRYGDQFGRRRRRHIAYGVGGAAAMLAVTAGAMAAGVSMLALSQTSNLFNLWASFRGRLKLRTSDGRRIRLSHRDLLGTRLRPSDDPPGFRIQVRKAFRKSWHEGEEAHRFASAILPKMNFSGGRPRTVSDAVMQIEAAGRPERLLADLSDGRRFRNVHGVPGYVNKMPRASQLALEMALHEEQERRALAGELWLLERAWEEAEEIAAISDNLFLPEGAEEFVEEHRG